MSLKFICPTCSYEIITGYLQIGDMLRCPSCGNFISLPSDAISTDEPSNIIQYTSTPEDDPISDEKHLPELPPPEPSEWGAKDVLRFGLYYYLCSLAIILGLSIFCAIVIEVFGNPGSAWAYDWDEPYRTYFFTLAGFLMDIVAIWLIYHYVVKKHHNDFFEALKLKKPTLKKVSVYLAFGVVLVIIGIIISRLLHTTPLSDMGKEYKAENIFQYGYFIAVIRSITPLTAAFMEEIIFRGFLFTGLKKSLGETWAIVIVSTLFIIGHGSRVFHDPVYLIGHIIFAGVVIWIRIRTDSVTNTIVVHFANNLVVNIIRWIRYLA